MIIEVLRMKSPARAGNRWQQMESYAVMTSHTKDARADRWRAMLRGRHTQKTPELTDGNRWQGMLR